jgi:thiamine transporter ThiT
MTKRQSKVKWHHIHRIYQIIMSTVLLPPSIFIRFSRTWYSFSYNTLTFHLSYIICLLWLYIYIWLRIQSYKVYIIKIKMLISDQILQRLNLGICGRLTKVNGGRNISSRVPQRCVYLQPPWTPLGTKRVVQWK